MWISAAVKLSLTLCMTGVGNDDKKTDEKTLASSDIYDYENL